MALTPPTFHSSPWSSSQLPLSSATSTSWSQAEWCHASALTVPWTLVTCDATTQRASFVAALDDSGSLEPPRLQCQVTTDDPPTLRSAEASALDEATLFPVALSLVIIGYFVHLIHTTQRHAPSNTSKSSRCRAIDAFRGLTIGLMIFVNYGGGGIALFQHSVWDGLTVADVVFPCFAWIMGFTMALGAKMTASWHRTVTRSIKLFTIGLFLNNGSSWAEWRIPGVLQSLSVGYLITVCLTRAVNWLFQAHGDRLRVDPALLHSVFGIVPIVTVNLVLTFALHVPGCPTGYVGPGGDSHSGAYRNCTGGAHLFIDRAVFGDRHIYQTPTCQSVFHTGPYDPEGLLNWLMIAATIYCGFLAGAQFKAIHSSDRYAQIRPLLVQATVFFLASSIVSGGFGVFSHPYKSPINKNLWSLSYVLVSVAVANATFAVLLFSGADHTDANAWTTWTHMGHNSIVIYTMHEILQAYAPFSPRPFGTATGLPLVVVLLQNVAGVMWWIFVAEWLHVRGIIISV